MSKITFKNIKSFIQGNLNLILNTLGNEYKIPFLKLDQHIKEQIAYRMDICGDTCKNKCISCGCSTPALWFSPTKCEGNKYPDFMDKTSWEKYKKNKNVII